MKNLRETIDKVSALNIEFLSETPVNTTEELESEVPSFTKNLDRAIKGEEEYTGLDKLKEELTALQFDVSKGIVSKDDAYIILQKFVTEFLELNGQSR